MISKSLLFIATALAAGVFCIRARSETPIPEKRTPPPSPLANATLAPSLKAAAERDGVVLYERAWVGGHVALQAFYDMANTIPEVREIALIAIERPSVWKLARYLTVARFHGGLGGPKTRAVDPAALGMMPVALEGFAVPFSMQFADDPIVQGELIVVSPLPPLDVTAGVLGLMRKTPNIQKRWFISSSSAQRLATARILRRTRRRNRFPTT